MLEGGAVGAGAAMGRGGGAAVGASAAGLVGGVAGGVFGAAVLSGPSALQLLASRRSVTRCPASAQTRATAGSVTPAGSFSETRTVRETPARSAVIATRPAV